MKTKNERRKIGKMAIFLIMVDIIALLCFLMFYGPFTFLSDRFVSTSMTTMKHKYFARTMYSEEQINVILKRNATIESGEQTNASAIRINDNADTGEYDSIYDEQILKRDKDNDLYKVIEIEDKSWNGWIIAIYDPSRIEAAISSNLERGAKTTMIAKENNAIIAINGGGFTRGTNKVWPAGNYIEDGKIIYNSGNVGKIIGFNQDNVLVLLDTTAEDAIKQGVRDALEFGPFLIVNGVEATFKGDGGYGKRSRTAIGQRQDGIVLFAVIDGKVGSTGISMPQLTDLFKKYKAYNAANLDGGGSTTLVIDNKLINSPKGWDYSGERWNVDAWIVK